MTGKKSRMLMVRSVVLSMEDFARLQAGEHVQGKRRSSRKAGEVLLLSTITWVRHRFMDTPPFSAAMQVALGGALVFATGILIGNA